MNEIPAAQPDVTALLKQLGLKPKSNQDEAKAALAMLKQQAEADPEALKKTLAGINLSSLSNPEKVKPDPELTTTREKTPGKDAFSAFMDQLVEPDAKAELKKAIGSFSGLGEQLTKGIHTAFLTSLRAKTAEQRNEARTLLEENGLFDKITAALTNSASVLAKVFERVSKVLPELVNKDKESILNLAADFVGGILKSSQNIFDRHPFSPIFSMFADRPIEIKALPQPNS